MLKTIRLLLFGILRSELWKYSYFILSRANAKPPFEYLKVIKLSERKRLYDFKQTRKSLSSKSQVNSLPFIWKQALSHQNLLLAFIKAK